MAATGRFELLDRIEKYVTPVLTAACSFLFFILVPFLPGSPILPILVSLGLAYYSVRRPRPAALVFYLLVLLSILWQLVGFGLITLALRPVGGLVALLMLLPLFVNFMNPRMSPASLSVIFLAVATMLTPEYYLSVPLVTVAILMDGVSNVAADASAFIFTLAPFILLENALYYASPGVSPSAPPIVFSQLTLLAAGIRPALPGINFVITGIPANFYSASIPAVVSFLLGKAKILLIPLIVFMAIFSISVSVGGILARARDKLLAFARLSRAFRVAWPAVATIVTSLVFAELLFAFSPTNFVGYQTELAQDQTHLQLGEMILGAVVFGGALSVNGYLNSMMRSVLDAKESLEGALGVAKQKIEELRKLLGKVNESAPSVGLRVESSVLDEYSSYISDIDRQKSTSNVEAYSTWDGDLRGRIIPTLESLPEQVRVKVVTELNSVVTISASLNTTMEHLGTGLAFPGQGLSVLELGTDEALETYLTFTAEVKRRVSELYALYVGAAKALDTLLEKTISEPPINPEVLISTEDYVTAMRLLAEDYSMAFHIEYSEELEAGARQLAGKHDAFDRGIGRERGRLRPLLDTGDVRPLDSPRLLKAVQDVVDRLRSTIDEAVADSDRLSNMVATLMPAATTTLKFETLAQSGRLKALSRDASSLKPALSQVAHFVVKAGAVLEGYRESERSDSESLIIVAQYPMAQRVIRGLAGTKTEVPLSELPFQPDAAHLYARIYSANNPGTRYDDQNEALLTSHA